MHILGSNGRMLSITAVDVIEGWLPGTLAQERRFTYGRLALIIRHILIHNLSAAWQDFTITAQQGDPRMLFKWYILSFLFSLFITIDKPPTPQPILLHVIYILLLNKNSPVSDLAVLEIVQSLLNTILVERVCHDGRSNVLAGSKLEELADTVARTDQRSLDTDTLDGELGQRNGSGLQSGGERVDGTVVIDDRGKTVIR